MGSPVQMLSGLMWALQIQPSFAIEGSEVMKACVNYAPCSSYELTPVFLAAVISWLLKILGAQRASREFAVRVSRRDGKMCGVCSSLGLEMGCPQVMEHCDPLQLFFLVFMFSRLMWFNLSSCNLHS